MRDDIQKILAQDAYLYGKDGNWRSYYQDVANFSLPRKAWITSIKANGEQLKYNFLYDVRVIRDVKKCGAGFHSQLSNAASKWWGMTTRDIKFRDSRASQLYFKECEDIIYSIMNNSNFDAEIQEHYIDDVVFGMGNLLTVDDPIDEVNYQEIPIEQYSIEEDARGRVIAMYRTFELPAITCYAEWGNSCSREILDCVKDSKTYYTMFSILHYVGPRDRRDVSKKDNFNMPWASLWIIKKGGHILDESGFEEFPYSVDRFWKDSNEARGYSPVMDVLASVKLVNAQKRTMIKTSMQMAGPAHLLPSKGFVLPFNLNPHASNYYDPSKTGPDAFKEIETKGNIPLTVEVMKLEQEEIDQGLFIPQFESLANITKQMTIPEVQRRVAESMYLLGPAVGRMTKTLRNILFRTYAILNRKGLLPDPPKELEGKDLEIMFLSPLAKAQRASELTNLTTFLEIAKGMAEVKSEVLDTLDADHILEIIGEVEGVDPTVFMEKKKVEEIRKNRAEQQKMIMQMQLAEQGAKAMKSGAGAHKDMAEANAK